jgi:hypothetical protein
MQQQTLYNKIFNKSESDWDTNLFLEKTVELYPYFGLAHYFNLKNTNSSKGSFAPIAAKTALYFNSPFLLQANLNNEQIEKEVSIDLISEIIAVKKENVNEIKNEVGVQNPVHSNVQDFATAEKVQISTVQMAENVLNSQEDNNASLVADFIEKEEVKEVKEELLFEPLFASDYFASQGIKLSEIVSGEDKLGKQLKSFTSWLKTMKKVHPDKLTMANEIVEKAVQQQAAISNVDAEVITEAMAEAFALQGKQIRALEIYEKLSLLNPTKSAYFAAKIELLKK